MENQIGRLNGDDYEIMNQINTMRESIFARTFRGERSTNDPDDESAAELLRRIL